MNYGLITALFSQSGSAVERMPVRARKVYLERHLQLVEAQIRALADELGFDLDESEPPPADQALDLERWDSLVSLDYLLAARDALRETITHLR